MKTSKFIPLQNNILVKRVKKSIGETVADGIIVPEASNQEIVEEVVVVAISAETHLNDTTEPQAKVGDRCLIHCGLNSVPIDIKGVPHLLITYANLLGIVS